MKKQYPIIDLYIRFLTFIVTCGLLNTIGLGEFSQSDRLQSVCSMNKLTVKGYNVKISDVHKIECSAKSIEIFALNQLIIDKDIDKTGLEVQLSLIAQTFIIKGTRSIKLNGISGGERLPPKASVGVGNGRHGKPGNPGVSGGSLMAIGKHFVNDEQLKMYINGGNGGAGQDGGDGTKHFY